jgi:hypothetical protein
MTARAGRQHKQKESKTRATARAERKQDQGDSKGRAITRAGSPATAETLAQQLRQHGREAKKFIVRFLPKLAFK